MKIPLPNFRLYGRMLAMAILLLGNGAFLYANSNKPCKAVAAQDAGHAVWLSKYLGGKHGNFVYTEEGGSLEEFEDGTAKISGVIYNKKNAKDQWKVEVWLSDRMTWEEWSALGRDYKDEKNKAGDLYKTWSYYIMDPGKTSALIGIGKNEGKTIGLAHNPVDYKYGFQVGQAANSKNGNYGLSGWMLYTKPNQQGIQGDFNLDLNCSVDEPQECPACFQTELLSSETNDQGCTQYTFEVSNDGSCLHALSHFTVAVPCGDLTDISNSEGWAIEEGTDPTTGLEGFKIDDIDNFGEKGQPGSFTVTFTVCNGETACQEILDSWQAEVAYKAGQCITKEIIPVGDGGDDTNDGDGTDGTDGGTDGSGGDSTDPNCDVNELAADFITTDISCFGAQDGAIALKINGGLAPFTFVWSHGPTSQDLTNLPAGNYSVIITDANQASLELAGTIFEPQQLTVSGVIGLLSCGASDGSIDVTVNGGTSPYIYSWSNGSNGEDLSGLAAGTYDLTVTDANGCMVNESFVLLATSDLNASISTNSCNDGNLVLQVEGGVGPYTYLWSTGETTKDIKVSATGSYDVTVEDANGCSTVADINVGQLDGFELSVTTVTPTCAGNNDGSIDLTVAGGVGPYTYLWSNGATTEDLSNVASGSYTVEVTDSRGCMQELTHFLRNPVGIFISADVTGLRCDGAADAGAVDISVFNAADPYTVSWSHGPTTEDLSGLTAGLYTITVTDNNGCSAQKTIEIVQPDDFEVDVSTQYCGDGRICPTINGGSNPFNYNWTDQNGNPISTTDGCIQVTEAGTYTVEVIDANGCIKVASITVGAPNPPLNTELVVSALTCAGDSDASADLTITGGEAPYSVTWSTGATTEDISGLGAGTYSVRVEDVNGCNQTRVFNIMQPEGMVLSGGSITQASCNGTSDGAVDITVTGGTTPYNFSWSNGASSEDISGVAAGTYTLIVTDASNCSVQMDYVVTVNPDNTNCDGGDGGDGGDGDNGDGGDGTGDGDGDGNDDPCVRDCNVCDGNVNALTMKYNGAEENAVITVIQQSGGQTVFEGNVAPNGEFSFTGADATGTFSTAITINVNGAEAASFNTSCSEPIGPGSIEGDFEIVAGESRNGGPLCPVDPNTDQEADNTEESETQDQEGGDCVNEFESQLISVSENEGCVTYTVKVTTEGAAHGLSHYSIRIPCGMVTDAENSRGWAMELNAQDPTTGIYGLKVDDIGSFGESDNQESFTVTYTVCSNGNEDCLEDLWNESIKVAYKAGQCVGIESIAVDDQLENKGDASLTFVRFNAYPNPVETETALSVEFTHANIGEALVIQLKGMTGNTFITTEVEIAEENEIVPLQLTGIDPGVYFLTVTSRHKVYTEKLIIK